MNSIRGSRLHSRRRAPVAPAAQDHLGTGASRSAVSLVGLGTALYVGWPDLRIIAIGGFFWALIIGLSCRCFARCCNVTRRPNASAASWEPLKSSHRIGELLPLAVAPGLAALFGVQAVLIGGGLLGDFMALGSLGEARAIDRENADKLAPKSSIAGVRGSDEPISPNP